MRFGLRILIPYPSRFRALLRLAGLFKPLMPRTLKQKVPVIPTTSPRSTTPHPRRMLILEGCAQSVTTPRTNEAAARTLDKLGIEVISAPSAGCCGAVSQHLSAHEEALEFVRRNIDAWWPYVEQGAEAIIITASGCGVMVKDYGELLKHDPVYSSKAQRIASLARDISEILAAENLVALRHTPARKVVAFHCPCTLQHGQKLNGAVEKILQEFGYTTVPVADSHLCCGSAGTYSVLQPDLAQQLLDNKLAALQRETPELIATANVGCQMHLATKAKIPVQHWVELINETLT